MTLKIKSTTSLSEDPKINMLVYGYPGVGKTTFAATAPKPIIADAESGATFLGARNVVADIASIKEWPEMAEFYATVAKGKWETIVLDPVGELLDKLLVDLKLNKAFVQGSTGALTIGGWGVAKDRMRMMLKAFRDMDKHVICVAHVDDRKLEQGSPRIPKIMANLSTELAAMMDIIGYYRTMANEETGEMDHRIYVSPTEEYIAKDRTGKLAEWIEPDFQLMLNTITAVEIKKDDIPTVESDSTNHEDEYEEEDRSDYETPEGR